MVSGKQKTFKSVKEEWINLKAPEQFPEFLFQMFGQLAGPNFRLLDEPIANLAHGVCGTEIEGEEISIGMMFVSNEDPHYTSRSEAAISSSIVKEWHRMNITSDNIFVSKYELPVLRKIVDVMRDSVLGWTPGHYEHPVLVFTYGKKGQPNSLELLGSHILRTRSRVTDAGYAYEYLSRHSRLAIWVKPHHTIRIYYDGRYLGHIVKLRDINSWALRSIEHLKKFLTKAGVTPERIPRILKTQQIYKLLLALTMVSEDKKGAALYIMPRKIFETGNIKGGFIPRVKHKVYNDQKYNIKDMPLGEILTYLRQDGSVVFDPLGNWLGAGAYFRTEGGRKKSAEEIAKNDGVHVFVVSQDGGLFFYSNAVLENATTPPPRGENLMEGDEDVKEDERYPASLPAASSPARNDDEDVKEDERYPGVRLDFLPIGEKWLREDFFTAFKSKGKGKNSSGSEQPFLDEDEVYRYAFARLKSGVHEDRVADRLIDLADITLNQALAIIFRAKKELQKTR